MKLGLRGGLVLLIVVGMPVASFFLVFKPQNREIDRAKAEIEHKETMLIKLREETARNDDLARANEETRQTVAMIERRLPSNKEVDDLVRQVSDLALQSGLQDPSLKSVRPVPAVLYMEQPIEMEVSGTFMGFHAFIANLEQLPRITRIHDLKILGAPKEDIEMKAQFTLSIYFQDEAKIAQGDAR